MTASRFLRVDQKQLVAALLESPVRLARRPDQAGVVLVFEVDVDLVAAFHGSVETAERLFRQFVAPRALGLAEIFWGDADRNPLVPDCELAGWVADHRGVLARVSPDRFEAVYRIPSRQAVEAFEARFPARESVP